MDENKSRLNFIETKLRENAIENISSEEKLEFRKNLRQLIGERNVRNLLDKVYNAQPFTEENNKTFAFFILGFKMYNSVKEGEKLTKGGIRIVSESGANPKLYSTDEINLLLKLYENNKALVDKLIKENEKEFTNISFFDKIREFLFPS